MQIYLARNNEQAGPYTLDQLNQMLANGQVVLSDLAWHEGMSDWQRLGELTQGRNFYQPAQGGSAVVSAPATPTPAASAQVKASPQHQTLAPVSRRIAAKITDFLLLWFPASIIFGQFITAEFMEKYQAIAGQSVIPSPQQQEQLMTLLTTLPDQAYQSLIFFVLVYFVFQAFLLHKYGQTMGKKAFGIMIVDDQTHEITTITRSFLLRSIVFILLNYFIFLVAIIDFAFLFTARHRTLHDRLAKTVVVNAPKQ